MGTFDSCAVFLSVLVFVVGFPVLLVAQIVIAFGWWSPVVLFGVGVFSVALWKLSALVERLR
ncbi:hypothetical protein [Corynebacterium guaraldiae]|uniref:hypothetical protein n=1 Tax=Corynebacterium guaraldiae TaxID=3051103 RepID=UPI0011785A95|nr:hypothetical protein [Corynebacterium guaraldiae]TRX42518.1 hypothetical protein FNY89_03220 [Corynebacterium guaraldiae]